MGIIPGSVLRIEANEGLRLAAVLAAGVLARAVVVVATHGLPYDIHSYELAWLALKTNTFHFYSLVNPAGTFHWPYPSGYLPVIALEHGLSGLFGGAFSGWVRSVPIIADTALAWLVWSGLRGRADEHVRLLAAALVSLGPVFVAVSGYSAQIDSAAMLPAVAALLVWERRDVRDRALLAGLLIGVGASVKTVPLLMVLALAPSARDRRELVVLVAAALAVPVVLMLPFLFADSAGVLNIRHYAGAPGAGGLSLLLQPSLAQVWLTRIVPVSGLERWLFIDHSWVPNALVVLGVSAYGWRYRPDPRRAAAVLWLMVLAFGSGFFFQYVVWVMPFLLLAGYVRGCALLQAAVTLPMLIFYVPSWHTQTTLYIYVAVMLVVWAGWVIGGGLIGQRAAAA